MAEFEESLNETRKETLENLNNLRGEYIMHKDNNNEKSLGVDIYERLVDIFGEETMLNLDFSNISDFEQKLGEYGGKISSLNASLEENLKLIKNLSLQDDKKNLKMNLYYFDDLSNTKKAVEFIDSFHKIYISNRIKKEDKGELLNDNELHISDAEKVYGMEIYDRLVRIYGEELILNSKNFSITHSDFSRNTSQYFFLQDIGADLKKIDEMKGISGASEQISADNLEGLYSLEQIASTVEEKKKPLKRQDEEKNKFKELIENSDIISKGNIDVMMKNLENSLVNGVHVVDKFEGRKNVAGLYYRWHEKNRNTQRL